MANELVFETTDDRKSRTSGVIWGLAKCGKSTFLLSLPGKKLYVMLDPDGDQSLPDHPDLVILRMYEQPNDVILRYLTDNLPVLLRKGEYNSVIYDSLSTLGQIALMEAIRTGVGASNKFTPTIEAPGLSAYGARTSNIVNIANKALRATSVVGSHCWFTSHEDEPKTNDKGEFLYITMTLSGKTISYIGLNVSEIWHMRMHDKKWFLSIANSRGKQPMGSRLFDVTGPSEFQLKFDPELMTDQPHSITTWYNAWVDGGRKKLPLPK